MKKIMFVCHGNICRSPMAEFIFKHIAQTKGVSSSFHIASSATSTEEIFCGVGNPLYPPARAELIRQGIPFSEHRAVQLKKDDYGKYDLFVAMDEKNVRNIMNIFGNDPDGKVKKLMDYTGRGGDVIDPWYSGDFEAAFCDISEGCHALFDFLSPNK